MINITEQGDKKTYNVISFVADTRTDISNLPTNCEFGSTCLVIEDSSVWILNGNKEWKEM